MRLALASSRLHRFLLQLRGVQELLEMSLLLVEFLPLQAC
jgi:hypothetical protein